MDHKVSKDMISSGMIPSGEKTQADLGRTQYGSAPSPSKLMDAYKSMYGNKEEVINEMAGKGMGMTPAPKPQGITPASKPQDKTPASKPQDKTPAPKTETSKTDSRMDQVVKHGFAKSYRRIGPKSEAEDMQDRLTDRKIERKVDKDMKRDRLKKIMADNESVDLLAAYHAVYEHHKKDADGNTIPHEDEELNEFVVTGTMAALKGLGAMATKLGTAAAKTGVKVGAKLGGKTGANLMKSVARNPMGAIDNINRVGYAAQTVGNLIPKPSVPAVTKKQNPQGGMISADVDLFDIVKGQLLDEGYSEKEVNEIMVNLTEEQLEEFLKQLATRAAQYGANIGREGSATGFLNQRADKKKVLPVKDQPVKGAADVVKAVSAADKPKPTPRKKPSPEQKAIRKEITDKMNRPHQSVMKQIPVDPIRRRKGEVEQENADLFDIVKGQLLDEGLSEEEIKDIMLTLTPDEIMKEMNQGPSTPVKNYGDSPNKPKILPNFGATRAKPRTTDKGTIIKGGKDTGKTPAQLSNENL